MDWANCSYFKMREGNNNNNNSNNSLKDNNNNSFNNNSFNNNNNNNNNNPDKAYCRFLTEWLVSPTFLLQMLILRSLVTDLDFYDIVKSQDITLPKKSESC